MPQNSQKEVRKFIKRRYCVIFHVGHLWPSGFGLISVRSLIYRANSLIFKQIFYSVFHCAVNVRGWVSVDFLLSLLCIVRVHSVNERGGYHAGGEKSYTGVCTKLFWCTLIAPIRDLIMGPL